MFLSRLRIENFRGFADGPKQLDLSLKPGLTALVGDNDAGKSAVIDALRVVLGTRDLEWYRLEDSDFHNEETSREIKICCTFEDLTAADQSAFVEYLSYCPTSPHSPFLVLTVTAKDSGETRKGRPYRRVEMRSGVIGDGPPFSAEIRELLRATYLRPLRDAAQALSSGRGSRLSQVLHQTEQVKSTGTAYQPDGSNDINSLNILGIGDLANDLLRRQQGIVSARSKIDEHLQRLSLNVEGLSSGIHVSGSNAPEAARLRHLLEKLDLLLDGVGMLGLGSNNLLFMACELLLLAQQDDGLKLLLIEEPEAHLHPQRQLRVMKYLQDQAIENKIQIIVTTHSPNLASAIDLNNLILIRDSRAYPLREGHTQLHASDYAFLARFLDVTKANLFFALGVLIVEGDAENILLPSLAALIGREFTEHGVSVVNVGGVGLRRYARILQRAAGDPVELNIPVACVTDMDVMPDCAPHIIRKLQPADTLPAVKSRRWRVKSDFAGEAGLQERKDDIVAKASGQSVKTFVADQWTLEYDLAVGPKEGTDFRGTLAEHVWVAACLAESDEAIHAQKTNAEAVTKTAVDDFAVLKKEVVASSTGTAKEQLASHIYAKFESGKASKTVAAQYLAARLNTAVKQGQFTTTQMREALPPYLVAAIDYVTRAPAAGSEP
jgi:putative ATP-dependent endonuclease of OLD family